MGIGKKIVITFCAVTMLFKALSIYPDPHMGHFFGLVIFGGLSYAMILGKSWSRFWGGIVALLSTFVAVGGIIRSHDIIEAGIFILFTVFYGAIAYLFLSNTLVNVHFSQEKKQKDSPHNLSENN